MLVVPQVAGAKTPRCFGKKATIVSSRDTVNGTDRADVIVVRNPGGAVVNGKGGNDLICGGRGFDWLKGGPGKDRLKGNGNLDFLEGDAGNDTMLGDTNDAGNPDDLMYQFAPGPVSVNLATGRGTGEGTDTFRNVDGVFGSQFDDSLKGDDGTNFIWGLGGTDDIDGGDGLDLVTPGDGNDSVDGGAGDGGDILYVNDATAAATVDLAAGTTSGAGIGTDSVGGFEHVVGSDFNDTITGDGQSNLLFGGLGDDTLNGAGDFDYAAYWFATGAVTANLQTNTSGGADGNDTFSNLEGLLGTIDFNDNLTGDNQNNYIDGDGGNDVLAGNGGDDWFVGGIGNDTVDGGPGGFDFWDYFGSDPVNANLTTGQVTAGALSVGLSNVEAVAGAGANDTLVGDDSTNFLYGWGGDDQITGAGGNDQIDAGETYVDGSGDDDSVDAGAGLDICNNAETLVECEDTTTSVQLHPLRNQQQAISNVRRSF